MGERSSDPLGAGQRKGPQGDATGFEQYDVLVGIDDDIERFGFCHLQLLFNGRRRGFLLSPALGRTGFSQDKHEEKHPHQIRAGGLEWPVDEKRLVRFQ